MLASGTSIRSPSGPSTSICDSMSGHDVDENLLADNITSSARQSPTERRPSSMLSRPRLSPDHTRLCKPETLPGGVKPKDLALLHSPMDSGVCMSQSSP